MVWALLCSQAMACELIHALSLDSMQESQKAALIVAAKEGRVGLVRKLIQQGVDVNHTDKVMDLSGVYSTRIPCCSCMCGTSGNRVYCTSANRCKTPPSPHH